MTALLVLECDGCHKRVTYTWERAQRAYRLLPYGWAFRDGFELRCRKCMREFRRGNKH